MEVESKRAGSHLTLQVLGGFLFVYLFFPVLLLWPFLRLYPGGAGAPGGLDKVLTIAFWPVVELSEHVPAYRSLMLMEFHWLGFK